VTDRRTDKQTDGRTELRWLRRATAVVAVARKNISKNFEQKSTYAIAIKHVVQIPEESGPQVLDILTHHSQEQQPADYR